jgi:peptidyl-lysine (3S)-dioxygenase / protease
MTINERNADSIVDGYFVEPHQEIVPFSEMVDWLVERRTRKDALEPVRYVQSQNGNLDQDYKVLKRDVRELEWANDCLGTMPIDSI